MIPSPGRPPCLKAAEPVLHKRSRRSEQAKHHSGEWPPLTTAGEKPTPRQDPEQPKERGKILKRGWDGKFPEYFTMIKGKGTEGDRDKSPSHPCAQPQPLSPWRPLVFSVWWWSLAFLPPALGTSGQGPPRWGPFTHRQSEDASPRAQGAHPLPSSLRA